MGMYTTVDVVPFVTHGVFAHDSFSPIEDDHPEWFNLLHGEIGHVRGWNHDGYDQIGKKNELYADKLVKGDSIVYLINESQYSNVGDYYVCVVSDKKSHIQEFINDFVDIIENIEEIEIDEVDAVQYTS